MAAAVAKGSAAGNLSDGLTDPPTHHTSPHTLAPHTLLDSRQTVGLAHTHTLDHSHPHAFDDTTRSAEMAELEAALFDGMGDGMSDGMGDDGGEIEDVVLSNTLSATDPNVATNAVSPSPQSLRPPRPQFDLLAQDEAGARLITHYFSVACRVMSCFDSGTNPYRTEIPRILHHSEHIFHAMMGMAASHMANYAKEMAVTAMSYQTQAMNILQQEMCRLRSDTAVALSSSASPPGSTYEMLLSTIMLGMTSVSHLLMLPSSC